MHSTPPPPPPTPSPLAPLRKEFEASVEEWKKSKDTYLYHQYVKIGEHLRTLQNQGMSVTKLALMWGTTDRNTIYKFLSYATTPHNAPRRSHTTTPAPPAPTPKETQKLPEHVAEATTRLPGYKPELKDFLTLTNNPDKTITVETVAPVPPELWPTNQNTTAVQYPIEEWTGSATWEDGILISDMRTSAPLHLAQKTLGGIEKLTA